MAKNLIIVESPAKARTLEKYLGRDFEALASYGHVRDLVQAGGRGVDTAAGFAPVWEQDVRGNTQMAAIEKAALSADSLYLATDPDREGEAISWHILEMLRERQVLDGKPVHRVVFHEVTKRAIQEAIDHPRPLSQELVEAYLARRILDYLLGYQLSPELWKKIKRGLSAGRVQSPALRLLCDREQEILAFKPREFWTIESDLQVDDTGAEFAARLTVLDGTKLSQFSITSADQAESVRFRLEGQAAGEMRVTEVQEKPRRRNPAPPFMTSTLQQEASRKLGFGVKKTMRVAQQLYEGVDFDGSRTGLVTYMRTDSVAIAREAEEEIRAVVVERYGSENVPDSPNRYRSRVRNAQEAHEAIRPTSSQRTPEQVKVALDTDQFRIYELIWKRAVASQMIPATLRQVTVHLTPGDADQNLFRATGSSLVDAGFLQVYREDSDDSRDESERMLPALLTEQIVKLNRIRAGKHFTEPKPRYTEASLVQELEARGIGRPSTWATILSTLVDRDYAILDRRRFVPTDLGYTVSGFLASCFAPFVDYEFTAKLEDELDEIANGLTDRNHVIRAFWQRLQEHLGIDHPRPCFPLGDDTKTGRLVMWRVGPYGAYVQLGEEGDDEELVRRTIPPGWRAPALTLERASWLLSLPVELGRSLDGHAIRVETGRYGLYLRCGKLSATIPADIDAMALTQKGAVKLIENASLLPRELGNTPDGDPVTVTVGRFGPYAKGGDVIASLGKEDDPYTITYERAYELICEKREQIARRTIQIFDGDIKVLRGRWGPYVTDGKTNARIVKGLEPESLTLEDCQTLLVAAANRTKKSPKKSRARATVENTTKKKTAKKKSAIKKTKKKRAVKEKAKNKTASKKIIVASDT